jgi:predicted amidohydrolase
MTNTFRVACIQTNSTREVAENVATVSAMIASAAADGANLICTPENVVLIEPKRELRLQKADPEESHAALAAFREAAAKAGAWVLAGSLAVRVDRERIANRSYLIDASGAVVASYDKIHMFDVDLPNGESYRESAGVRPGDRAALADTPWGPIGLTICYDLRFPHLYRALAQAGAMYLAIPSAFTRPTGQAHWHVLQRARAIETGCYVFAPAQCGVHAENRKTYGHSLIVAPWGEVLADGGDEPGFITAEIDPAKVLEARRMVPSLQHDRPFAAPELRARRAAIRAAGE